MDFSNSLIVFVHEVFMSEGLALCGVLVLLVAIYLIGYKFFLQG